MEQRLRRGQELCGSVSLRRPSAEERRATDALLARSPSRGRSLTVRLEDLQAGLVHADLAADLEEAMSILVGDVMDRRTKRLAEQARLHGLLEAAKQRDPRPPLHRWLDSRRTWVLLRRYGKGRDAYTQQLLDAAMDVASRLPSAGPQGLLLQELAVEVTGDGHALDPGGRLSTLVIAGVAELVGGGDWHDAAVGQVVGVKPTGKRKGREAKIAELLTELAVQRRFVHERFAQDERELLELLLEHPKGLPADEICAEFGDDSNDGWFWNEIQPESVLGLLRAHGFVFVGGSKDGTRTALIPEELREGLAAALAERPKNLPYSFDV